MRERRQGLELILSCQRSLRLTVLAPFLSAKVVDVVTEFAREGALSELLYAEYSPDE